MKHTLAILVVLVLVAPAAAEVEPASIFGSEMVLQQETPVVVWGRADPDEKVSVAFGGQTKSAIAGNAGHWSVTLDPMPASDEPRTLTISGAGDAAPVAFENVRVGEVWLMLSHDVAKQYSCEGPVPTPAARIRSFGSRENHSPTRVESYGGHRDWVPGRSETFNLVEISFLNKLHETLDCPVAAVWVQVGELDATIPVEGFCAIDSLKDVAEQVETWYPTTPGGAKAYAKWYAELKKWKQGLDARLASGASMAPSQPPLAPGPKFGDPTQPTVVFNKQLAPLVPFAFRGAFYVRDGQAMSDSLDTQDPRGADKMRALIAGLRIVFQNPNMSFGFTQRDRPTLYHMHTCGGKETRDGSPSLDFRAWHGHRDRQRQVALDDGVGMIVTADLDGHDARLGHRFANWAVVEAYGQKGAASGPIYKSCRREGDRMIVEFEHVDGGLTARDGKSPLRLFAVAGEDRIFRSADATIEGDTVVVRSPRVSEPVAVRYACHFDPIGMNLHNGVGLPASPFRTDDWPIDEFDAAVEKLQQKGVDDLAAMLGYPTMLHSHAAAKALGLRGEKVALPAVKRLLQSDDPDQRAGALRTLGYTYWHGPIPRGSGYYGLDPQEVTPAVAAALDWIEVAVDDPASLVRRTAAEALTLIGAENDQVSKLLTRLAVDDDALVRTAALRACKYRMHGFDHNTSVAYAVLERRPFVDGVSLKLAGTLLNHYRIHGELDVKRIADYFRAVAPGEGGAAVPALGDAMRRIQTPDGIKALGDPDVMDGVLHLYSLGYRRYFLYGVWHWVDVPTHAPDIKKKMAWMETEIERLQRQKPTGWKDLSGRYADAILGLEEVIEKYATPNKKK